MRFIRRWWRGPSLLLVLLCLTACKTSEDAVAAAQQMAATSATLSHFYDALSGTLRETVALNELNASLLQVSFDDAARKQIEQTDIEIRKRAQMATALANLSASFGSLAGSQAPANAAAAASALGTELVGLKALPDGPPIPALLGKAAGTIVQLLQEHQERKAAKAMDDTLAVLAELFAKEQPVYDSLARQRIVIAKSLTIGLLDKQAVDPTPMLTPALRPFQLSPLPASPALQTTLRSLAKARLDTSADRLSQGEAEASAAMLQALQEMSARVHTVAVGRPMASRGNPFSLTTVDGWLDQAEGVL